MKLVLVFAAITLMANQVQATATCTDPTTKAPAVATYGPYLFTNQGDRWVAQGMPSCEAAMAYVAQIAPDWTVINFITNVDGTVDAVVAEVAEN